LVGSNVKIGADPSRISFVVISDPLALKSGFGTSLLQLTSPGFGPGQDGCAHWPQ